MNPLSKLVPISRPVRRSTPMPRALRTVFVSAIALGLVALASACGGGDSDSETPVAPTATQAGSSANETPQPSSSPTGSTAGGDAEVLAQVSQDVKILGELHSNLAWTVTGLNGLVTTPGDDVVRSIVNVSLLQRTGNFCASATPEIAELVAPYCDDISQIQDLYAAEGFMEAAELAEQVELQVRDQIQSILLAASPEAPERLMSDVLNVTAFFGDLVATIRNIDILGRDPNAVQGRIGVLVSLTIRANYPCGTPENVAVPIIQVYCDDLDAIEAHYEAGDLADVKNSTDSLLQDVNNGLLSTLANGLNLQ